MGVIRQIGNSWYIDYRCQGRRIVKKVGKNKRTAELKLKQIELAIERGEPIWVGQGCCPDLNSDGQAINLLNLRIRL